MPVQLWEVEYAFFEEDCEQFMAFLNVKITVCSIFYLANECIITSYII